MPWIRTGTTGTHCVMPKREEYPVKATRGLWQCPTCGRNWYMEKELYTGAWVSIGGVDSGGGCGD